MQSTHGPHEITLETEAYYSNCHRDFGTVKIRSFIKRRRVRGHERKGYGGDEGDVRERRWSALAVSVSPTIYHV